MGSHHSRPTSERSISSSTARSRSSNSRPGSIKSLKRFSRRFSRESILVPTVATSDAPAQSVSDTAETTQPSSLSPGLESATEQDKVSSRQSRPFVHRPHRHTPRSPSPPWQPVSSSRRTRSILSYETNDSNTRLSSSAGSSASMMWSGGMFSQLDPASTITTVTAFSSTISRRSQFCQDWPSTCDEDKLAAASTNIQGADDEEEQDLQQPTNPQDLLQQLKENRSDSHRILRQAIVSARTSDDQSKVFQTITLWGQETNDPCALVWSARCLLEGWGTALDTDKGFNQLRKLADLGCWESFYPLAEHFYRASNMVEAAHWFKAAAELEPDFVEQHKEAHYVAGLAQYRLGELIFKGQGVTEDAAMALEWFHKSAQNGNKYGQYITGVYFEQGIVVEKDIDIAEQYLLSSAQQGFTDAQAALGILLVDHKENIKEGKHWLEHAAQVNNARALLKLGIMFEHGQGVDADYEQALYYYKTAAVNADDAVAQYIVGLHYRLGGLGLQVDYKEAGRFLHRSAKAGFAPAQRIIGLMFAQGLLGKKDEKTALLWFRRAASQGDVRALCLVGSCYERGCGGVQASQEIAMEHYQKAARITSPFQGAAQLILGQLLFSMDRYRDAFDWFQKAAASTEVASHMATSKALLMIARYYLHGWAGVKKDPSKAFNILVTLAKDDQDGAANYWLAACYEEGLEGVCPCDLKIAFKHYMIAAQTGDTDAEFQVALMLSNGQGVSRDRKSAMPWYEKAARKGHKVALYSLGLYYAKGIAGTPVDLHRARICFEKAAKKGVIAAMTSLAMLYRIATGGNEPKGGALVSRFGNQHEQRELMIHWYQKAASLGDAVAQRELAMLYDAGFGVAQDYQTAFQLLQLAAEQNDARATLLLGSYYQNGLAVETDITKALELYHAAAKLGAPVASFAAAQVYHSQNQFQEAFTQYLIAARDSSLAETRIGKSSRFMVARYILGYITMLGNAQEQDAAAAASQPVNVNTGSLTKQEAFEMLLNLAEKDAFEQSFYWLGECYRLGNGVKIDLAQAVVWYQQAADVAKDLEAMIKLAAAYEQGLGVEKDDSKAFLYYQTSAEQGHPEAQHKMGMAYWRGLYNVDINLGEAVVWFTRSAVKYAASSWALGQMALENGDEDVAIAWWHKSIALGHAPSMRALASLLLQTSSEQSQQKNTKFERAMELLAEAVRSGDAESLVLLGQLHQAGAITSPAPAAATAASESDLAATVMMSIDDDDGSRPDEQDAEMILQKQQEEQELATRCFQQAAAMGHVEAMFLAAQSWHAQEQFAAALEFYERAASHGHLLSRVMKARYQIAGLAGLPADPEAGYRELMECAQNEHCVDAYNSLGQCHELGLGVPQDDRRALEWYLQSAEATQDAEAMFRIGQMHAQGRVPTQDPTLHKDMEALQWYKFACESRKHPRAHYYIGLYYLYGIRDERNPSTMFLLPDPAVALHHFRQAAEQGDKDAMFELAQLLMDLDNNENSAAEAFDWFERSAQMGSSDSQRELGKLYHSGKPGIVAQDFEKAYDLFCRAAQEGDKTATLFIGIYHEHGIHVPPNVELAREWYEVAVKLGQRQERHDKTGEGGWWLAELALARLLHQQRQEMNNAYALFKAAYDHAPVDQKKAAMIMVSLYQLYGWGNVPARPSEAAASLLKLATQDGGEPKVFIHVAKCFHSGLGVEKDRAKAFEWFGRIVTHHQDLLDEEALDEQDELDYAEALFYLAEYYEHGWDNIVPIDHSRAKNLYQLAAEHGSQEAQLRISKSLPS